MIEERELLQRCLDEFDYKGVACNELCIDIHKLLAQPEQPEQEPLSEATINYYLERLGSHFKWDDGFIAGVKWAEKAHGIGVDDDN